MEAPGCGKAPADSQTPRAFAQTSSNSANRRASPRETHAQELWRGHLATGRLWTFSPGNPHPGKPGDLLRQGRPGGARGAGPATTEDMVGIGGGEARRKVWWAPDRWPWAARTRCGHAEPGWPPGPELLPESCMGAVAASFLHLGQEDSQLWAFHSEEGHR